MSERWHDVFDAGTLREQGLTNVIVDGRDVALYAVDDEVFASDNRCTHGDARLSDGFLLGDEIECPLHQGRFSLRTGEPMCAPLQHPVRVFPVKIEGGRVFVSVDGDEQAVDVVVTSCAQGCAEGR